MKDTRYYHLEDPTWCPGCGLYGIFKALKNTAVNTELDPELTVLVSGIGCHGRINNYFKAYGFHTLHGRALPLATGIRLSNPTLTVITVVGDGDAYSIGLSHLIHALRRNINLTCMVVNNQIFALTQGQTSPTSQWGYISVSTPYGSKEIPLDGPGLALASGGTFIARGFSADPTQLSALLTAGLNHQGFSLIEILSPCVTQNKINTYKWYKENTFNLEKDSSFDAKNKKQAMKRLYEGGKISLGLIYRQERASYEKVSLSSNKPIVEEDLKLNLGKLEKIMEKFK